MPEKLTLLAKSPTRNICYAELQYNVFTSTCKQPDKLIQTKQTFHKYNVNIGLRMSKLLECAQLFIYALLSARRL